MKAIYSPEKDFVISWVVQALKKKLILFLRLCRICQEYIQMLSVINILAYSMIEFLFRGALAARSCWSQGTGLPQSTHFWGFVEYPCSSVEPSGVLLCNQGVLLLEHCAEA